MPAAPLTICSTDPQPHHRRRPQNVSAASVARRHDGSQRAVGTRSHRPTSIADPAVSNHLPSHLTSTVFTTRVEFPSPCRRLGDYTATLPASSATARAAFYPLMGRTSRLRPAAQAGISHSYSWNEGAGVDDATRKSATRYLRAHVLHSPIKIHAAAHGLHRLHGRQPELRWRRRAAPSDSCASRYFAFELVRVEWNACSPPGIPPTAPS